MVIKASKEEQEMITTDRAELEAILKEPMEGDFRPPSQALRVGWERPSSFMASAAFRYFR